MKEKEESTVKLVEIKQQLRERVPEPDMHAALAHFEAHLIAILRRKKFTICPPRKRTDFTGARAAISQVSGRPKICKASS